MILRILSILFLLLFSVHVSTGAEPPASLPAGLKIISLGRPVTFGDPPTYHYTVDPDDARQLTDGVYTQGHFWTTQTTVGWSGKPKPYTIDLGAAQPIRGVSMNCGGALESNVLLPFAIFIYVSDDNQSWHYAGELTTLSARHGEPPLSGYVVHRFWTDALRTRGRYVTFAASSYPFHFVDEIEIYAGEDEWMKEPLAGESVTDIPADWQKREAPFCIEKRLSQDLVTVRRSLSDSKMTAEAKDRLARRLDAIEKEIPGTASAYHAGFRTTFPLHPVQSEIFKVQAGLWRESGHPALAAWGAGAWDPLSPYDAPDPARKPAVAVRMMQNEYRAAAFNLASAGNAPIEARLRVSGLPQAPQSPYLTVHQVEWTDAKRERLIAVAAALPVAPREGEDWVIRLHPGLTRQVWLTFHSAGLAPGHYSGRIEVRAADQQVEIPVELTIDPLRFPDRTTLVQGGWDYTNLESRYGVTPQNREQIVRHLREHFVNGPWATNDAMPSGDFDAEGNMTRPPDTTNFDQWLALWPGADTYFVFLSVNKTFGGSEMGTPLFDRKVQAWIRFWADHARRKGLKPEQLVLLIWDEPHKPEHDQMTLVYQRPINAAKTGVRIMIDPVWPEPDKASQEMMKSAHLLCPDRGAFISSEPLRNYYLARQKEGATLGYYLCAGPALLLDPYAYYRMQGWTASRYGAKYSGFWAFGDNGGSSSWNEYAVQWSNYCPYFIDATTVTAGKQMEAVREGIEDYEYFQMLERAIAAARTAGAPAAALAQAEQLLREGPARAHSDARWDAASYFWHQPRDRTAADRIRLEVLDALMALASAGSRSGS